MVEVMTDKATVEIPSPRAGRVAKRISPRARLCPVGKVLVVIDVERDASGAAGGAAPTATAAARRSTRSGEPARVRARSAA